VYRLALEQQLADNVQIGNILHVGEQLTQTIKVIDQSITPNWWNKEITTKKLAFASHVFAANTAHQLFFENSPTLVTYTVSSSYPNGRLVFPVSGREKDIKAFQDYINTDNTPKDVARKHALVTALGMNPSVSGAIAVNPVDFVFNNIFKNNTLLLKLAFQSSSQLDKFFTLLPTIQKYLPPHVYIMTYLQLNLPQDSLTQLNTGFKLLKEPYSYQMLSMDGSIAHTGARPGSTAYGDPLDDPDYYKDYINRVFCISVGPYRYNEDEDCLAPLHDNCNLDKLRLNASVGITTGTLRTEIPELVYPPGELPRKPSTREVQSILLIDF
jgi:hypothetical protein